METIQPSFTIINVNNLQETDDSILVLLQITMWIQEVFHSLSLWDKGNELLGKSLFSPGAFPVYLVWSVWYLKITGAEIVLQKLSKNPLKQSFSVMKSLQKFARSLVCSSSFIFSCSALFSLTSRCCCVCVYGCVFKCEPWNSVHVLSGSLRRFSIAL